MGTQFIRNATPDGLCYEFSEAISLATYRRLVNLLRVDYGLTGVLANTVGSQGATELRVASWLPYGRSALPESILKKIDAHVRHILDGEDVPGTNLSKTLQHKQDLPTILEYMVNHRTQTNRPEE